MNHPIPTSTHFDIGVKSGQPALDISVIIVSWNAYNFLEECLESLSKGVSRSYEVIVVDNASTDGSPRMVAGKFPWAVLIQTGANLGFSKGNNIGIRHSRGRHLALVNSDVNVLPGCLDALAQFLDSHTDVGMAGPRIMYGNRRQQSSCRRFPNLWNNTCEVFHLNKIFPRSAFFAGEHMFYFSYKKAIEPEVLVGCFIMARREAVAQFGLLDEDFWMYGEDIDWSRRCWQSGWKISYYPGAEAIHYCGGSSSNAPLRFALAQQDARLRLWKKHHSCLRCGVFICLLSLQCCFRLAATAISIPFSRSKRQQQILRAKTQLHALLALFNIKAENRT